MPKITIEIEQEDLDRLKDLCHEVATQDPQGTADPVFIILENKEYSADDDYADGVQWINDEGSDYSEEDMREEIVEREIATKEEAAKMDDYELARKLDLRRFPYQKIEQIKEVFLTRKAAKGTMEGLAHHYIEPSIWVGSAHQNYELRFVRKLLINIWKQIT